MSRWHGKFITLWLFDLGINHHSESNETQKPIYTQVFRGTLGPVECSSKSGLAMTFSLSGTQLWHFKASSHGNIP